MPSIVVTSAAAIWSPTMTHIGNERVGWDVGVLVEVAVPTGSTFGKLGYKWVSVLDPTDRLKGKKPGPTLAEFGIKKFKSRKPTTEVIQLLSW